MPRDPLPEDPDSLDRWEAMPRNQPSKDALPPMTGGTRLAVGLLILMAVLIILAVLLRGGPA